MEEIGGDRSLNADVARVTIRTIDDLRALERRDPMKLVPGATIYEVLRHAVRRFGDKTAIVPLADAFDRHPQRIRYTDYVANIEQAANLFHCVSGDTLPVVAIVAPFLPEALVAMWGGAVAGRYLPINPYLSPEHIAAIMNTAKATVLVVADVRYGPGGWQHLGKLRETVPTLRRCFVIDSGEADDFARHCAAQEHGQLEFSPSADGEVVCGFMHTGGTTAAPKLVQQTHAGVLLQAWMCGMAMGSDPDEVIGHAMPNFHLGGAIAKSLRAIVYGQTLVTLTPLGFRDSQVVPQFWNIVEDFGITSIVTAPTTIAAILAAEGHCRNPQIKYTSGGSALPKPVAQRFEDRFGVALREVWGGTEFQGILSFHFNPPTHPRWGSCGRSVPFCQVRTAVLDGNRFVRLAEAGERGTIIATAPTTMPGFVDPAGDSDFFLEGGPDARIWATTGDIGHQDENGFIWIAGRARDVIIRGGHNIDSAVIDDAMAKHPAVLNVAAVGKPCPTRGELPMIFVEMKAGADVTTEELLAFARDHITERAAVPVEIVVLDKMPLTAVGKVFKPSLRDLATLRVVEQLCAELGLPDARVGIEEDGGRQIFTIALRDANAPAAQVLAERLSAFTFNSRVHSDPAISY